MNGEELIARHQLVRAFVEKEFPERRVTEIREDAKTTYRAAKKPPHEHILESADTMFTVEAMPFRTTEPGVQCKVAMMEDGSLRIYDTYWVHYGVF